MMKRTLPVYLVTASMLLGSTLAFAQSQSGADNASLAEAKTYYTAGAAAYERGDFDAAIQAFLEAQKRAERPAVLFAVAQAFRRKYYVDRRPDSLQSALKYYRAYLAADPRGQRAADAAQALAELAPAEERFLADPNSAQLSTTRSDDKTRLAISASAASGAEISVDGGDFAPAPLMLEITAGKHTVVVRAPGYEDESREVVAVAGSLVALDVPLRDKPASLLVIGEPNARLEIDGRLVSVAPGQPVSIQPGRRLVALSRRGHEPIVRELTFQRGEHKKLQVELRTTSRRRISNGFLIASGVGLVGTAVLTAIAIERDSTASNLLEARERRNLSTDERERYQSARSGRNAFALAAGVGGGATAVLAGLGLTLRVFDDPARNAPSIDSDLETKPSDGSQAPAVELGFTPWATPGGAGSAISGRF